jgi:GNAT superfamily N-acetyltransferase
MTHNGGAQESLAGIDYRCLRASDDVGAITEMLHAAYRPLAEAGLRFVASHQDIQTTRRRLAAGETYVAVVGDRTVGIITWRRPGSSVGCEHYRRPDVATFGQFAVDPSFQRQGVGSSLLRLVEDAARSEGFAELALDTSERAAGLIRLYESKGFEFVEHVQWESVNYPSVVLSKKLAR